jgi:Protein of unknown function (DUF2892)
MLSPEEVKTIKVNQVALVFVGLYFANVVTGTLAIVLLVLAGVFVLTALIGFCPLYWPFGINTWGKKK